MFGLRFPRGFAADNRRIYHEMHEWVGAGLIPPFEDSTMVEKVMVDMLQAVRERLTEQGPIS